MIAARKAVVCKGPKSIIMQKAKDLVAIRNEFGDHAKPGDAVPFYKFVLPKECYLNYFYMREQIVIKLFGQWFAFINNLIKEMSGFYVVLEDSNTNGGLTFCRQHYIPTEDNTLTKTRTTKVLAINPDLRS